MSNMGIIKEKLKWFIPPIILEIKRYFYSPQADVKNIASCTERACHYNELFVRSNGDVYPCCLVWNNNKLKIGHLSDSDILNKIENYSATCSCERFKLITGKGGTKNYSLLNIELSYKCQGQCAMCCVNAPDYIENYNTSYFDILGNLISSLSPKELLVQGGEILVQAESIEWLTKIKQATPEMSISLVTNGNNIKMVDYVSRTFNRITVSFVGFQPATYKTIMGLNIETTKQFCEKVIRQGNTRVYLKYLITPNNLHELPLFLEWAIRLAPEMIYFADANTRQYINENTNDHYWAKIIDRTLKEITKVLRSNKEFLESELNNRFEYIGIGGESTRCLFSIDNKYIVANDLTKILKIDKY